MSRFPHGTTGGGGVKRTGPPARPGGPPARPGPAAADRSPPEDVLERRWPNYLQGGYFDDQGNLKIEYVSRCIPGDEHLPDNQQHGVERFVLAMTKGDPSEPKLTS